MQLHNTLTRRVEEFVPREPGVVRMYTCGPTVYRYAHIGNLRSYLLADWVRRSLELQGYQVHHVKNITDVGHMRQEMLERGEDKVIAAALAEGKTPQEIADFYTEAFHRDEANLNIAPAHHFPKATDHIQEMVEITQRLLDRGVAYEVEGTVYFAVSKFPEYGKLSGNTQSDLLEGVRAEADPHKRDPRDFTLWKAAEPGRELKWDSPWGPGFPGWHIECSAMSIKYLGEHQDIHTGGVDNIFPHHEGEIAQSEGAFQKPYVNYWVHGQHLLADGLKMAKSTGNAYTLKDLESRGFDPLAFRYMCLTVHYRTRLNFTFSSLRAAQRGLTHLRQLVWEWWDLPSVSGATSGEVEQWRRRFWDRVNDDLALPEALAVIWHMVRSDLPPQHKLSLLLEFDQLLGLNLREVPERYQVPPEVQGTLVQRHQFRERREFVHADSLGASLQHEGYVLHDTRHGFRARPKTPLERRDERWKEVSSSRQVSSLLETPDAVEFSINVVACNYLEDVKRCLLSALRWNQHPSLEVVAVDSGSTDGTGEWLEELSRQDERVRVIHADHPLGEAEAKNIALKQSRGTFIVQLDPSVEVIGDLLTPLREVLSLPSGGVVGPFGLCSEDLRHFNEVDGPGKVDAMQAYCFAFRRWLLQRVGLMPESFRFYRNLDIVYSFRFKDAGYSVVADPSLPVVRHEHRVWSAMTEGERDRLSIVNFKRFLKKFGHRHDLLVANKG